MAYTPKQCRAINRYIKQNNVKPELSAFPFLRFTTQTGTIHEEHITNIEIAYEAWQATEKVRKSEEAKEARRAKRLEKKL